MANIRAQELTTDHVSLTGGDGRSITLTRQQVLAHFQSETGNKAARIAATIAWAKDQIVTALGPENIDPNDLAFDFDDVAGMKRLALGPDSSVA